MYADNAGAVIGDLLYQPPPCGWPSGLASLMQKRLSPWMECVQKQCWEHCLSWRFCYSQGCDVYRFCRSKNRPLRSSRSHFL